MAAVLERVKSLRSNFSNTSAADSTMNSMTKKDVNKSASNNKNTQDFNSKPKKRIYFFKKKHIITDDIFSLYTLLKL